MTKLLDLSAEVKLPVDVVTQVLAFIGRCEAGKSYSGQKLAEPPRPRKGVFL